MGVKRRQTDRPRSRAIADESVVEPPSRNAVTSALGRSVFLSQITLGAVVLILVLCVQIFDAQSVSSPSFFIGVAVIFVVTGFAVILPWHVIGKNAAIALPLLDIAGIAFIRHGEPSLGAGVLFVFPVIWMSTHYGVWGAVLSTTIPTALLVAGALADDGGVSLSSTPQLVTIPLILAFVATMTYQTRKRVAAHRVLLRQQTLQLETVLERSRLQQRLLDSIFNTVNFGILAFDANGNTTTSNSFHRRLVDPNGAGPSGIEKAVRDVVYQADRETPYVDSERPYFRALGGESFDGIIVWLGEPGTEQTALAVSARQIDDGHGNWVGGVIVESDITAEINALKERDVVVAAVSHELRTPLTSIQGYIDLALEDDAVGDGTRKMLEVALANSDRVLAIIADLLGAASGADPAMTLTFADCDLSELVRRSIEAQRPAAERRGIRLAFDDRGAVPLIADGFRLRQVIDNLVSNAVKYNVDGGLVQIAIEADAAEAELIVVDTGRGMTADEQSRLFERFYRAASVRDSPIDGTGLGLSISREIVLKHGGDIRIYSEVDEGTTAIVTIPRAP
ncbi:ATP-binding protein [Compostimonas suwonensis]|uniref:histidine kinase n=1 Tax=Compostimonas suwonensis TaxID=1048394 RepID=A0A2M9BCF3_9MICO|nr:ATP-binding protein [Compostimonas suwonensis]PJJ55623.1 phospho-acceptor domain-containing protein [Compostimonas suwonensis]